MSDVPVLVPVSRIDPYPKNPRRFPDAAFEDCLTATLKAAGEFDPAYSIIVRPKPDGRYEALGGDRRLRCSGRAGLKEIWCWVRQPSTEEEAFEIAVESNRQAGLSKLELALAALEVERAPGKAGKGVTAFARAHGLKGSLARYQKGARVYLAVEAEGRTSENVLRGCRDLAEHLARIHEAVPERWAGLVERCVTQEWSITQTESEVAKVGKESGSDIPAIQPRQADEPDGEGADEGEGEDGAESDRNDEAEPEDGDQTDEEPEDDQGEDDVASSDEPHPEGDESEADHDKAMMLRQVRNLLSELRLIRSSFRFPASRWADLVRLADAEVSAAKFVEALKTCARLADLEADLAMCPDKRAAAARTLRDEIRSGEEEFEQLLKGVA